MRGVAIILALWSFISCSDSDESVYPTKTRLTESVYASAMVQPDSLYMAHAMVAGILERNLVEEGDTVTKGMPLIQITDNAQRIDTENAKLALQLAEENYRGSANRLDFLKNEIKSATLNLRNDSINYFRQKKLWEQNIGSKLQYENRKLAYEISRNDLTSLRNRYERTQKELSTQLEQARNNYRTSQIATQDFTVTSKIDGKVYALFKNQGELVNTMEPLASVGSAHDFVIELLVDEVDIVQLCVGQKALITLEAYGTEIFEATVSKIYPRKDERSQTFMVEALFDASPEVLYPGLSGEGNIVIDDKKDVLTIPKSYLVEGDKVLTSKGLVAVVLGLQDMERVEVLEGIDEHTKILKPRE